MFGQFPSKFAYAQGVRMEQVTGPKYISHTTLIPPPQTRGWGDDAQSKSKSIGHNLGRVATPTQDTRMAQSSQQAGTHFANLRRMTG